jgi:hypothetical protein
VFPPTDSDKDVVPPKSEDEHTATQAYSSIVTQGLPANADLGATVKSAN